MPFLPRRTPNCYRDHLWDQVVSDKMQLAVCALPNMDALLARSDHVLNLSYDWATFDLRALRV